MDNQPRVHQEQEVVISEQGQEKFSLSTWSVAIIVAVLVALVIGYFAWDRMRPLTVQNISYFGIYFGPFSTSAQSAAAMVFDRWGDSRTSFDFVLESLPSLTREYTLQDIATLFAEKGYEVDIVSYESTADMRTYLKSGIPVVTELLLMPEREKSPAAFFIVVGDKPLERTVVTFENMFGYNYELSYDEFEKMSAGPIGGRMLIIEPTDEILSALNQPTAGSIDLPRAELFDSIGLQEYYRKMSLVNMLENRFWEYDSRSMLGEVVQSPAFKDELHPRHQVHTHTLLALEEVRAGDLESAEQILLVETIPRNKDLDKGSGQWPELTGYPSESAFPWRVLGVVYYAKGELDKAQTAFERSVSINMSDEYSKRRLEELRREGG